MVVYMVCSSTPCIGTERPLPIYNHLVRNVGASFSTGADYVYSAYDSNKCE